MYQLWIKVDRKWNMVDFYDTRIDAFYAYHDTLYAGAEAYKIIEVRIV